jgi:hypothetical protein
MKEVIKIFNHNFKFDASFSENETDICKTVHNFLRADPNIRLTPENYVEIFSYTIQIADCGQELAMMAYDKQNQRLMTANGYYALNVSCPCPFAREESTVSAFAFR